MKLNQERFYQIDLARGIAVILMVIFNWSVALDYFKIFSVGGGWLYWWLFPRLIAGAFILLAGISFFIMSEKIKNHEELKKKSFARGAKIFSLGILATAATFFLTPAQTIWFGILHFFGVSFLLAPFFRNFGKANLVLGIFLMVAGFLLNTISLQTSWLLWLGFPPENFTTFDYFPMLPWFGLTLIGIYFGKIFYSTEKINPHQTRTPAFLAPFIFFGRNSLAIYAAHQPLLIAVLHILGFKIF